MAEPYADAVASARLEGIEPTAETMALLRRMQAGEITADDAVAVIIQGLQVRAVAAESPNNRHGGAS